MKYMTRKFTNLCTKRQRGASMIEYALIVAAVVAIAVAFFAEGGAIYEAIKGKLEEIVEAL